MDLEPTWLQKIALEEMFRMLKRCSSSSKQLKNMGFTSLKDAALFEFTRIERLSNNEYRT